MAIADDEGPERRTHPAASANPSHRCKGLVHVDRLFGSGRSTREHCSHESLVMHCPDVHEPLSGYRSTRRSSRSVPRRNISLGPDGLGLGGQSLRSDPQCRARRSRARPWPGSKWESESVRPSPFGQSGQDTWSRIRSRRNSPPSAANGPVDPSAAGRRPAPSAPAVDAPSPWVPLQGRYPFPG